MEIGKKKEKKAQTLRTPASYLFLYANTVLVQYLPPDSLHHAISTEGKKKEKKNPPRTPHFIVSE